MDAARRIIDANANRAREALRVLEDAARFALNDAERSATLKALRHDLADALAELPGGHAALIAARDAAGDVGTSLSTPAERTRTSMRDVAAAAGKRLTEALRSIEEAGKTFAPESARRVETLRYRAYDAERDLLLAMPTGRAPQRRLCVIVTERACAHGAWLGVARAAADGGADCLQLREKHLDDRELLGRARALVEMARSHPRRPAVVINDRVDIALLASADGVHLGQTDVPPGDARALAGDRLTVGVSVTTAAQADAARVAGADELGVGPMFGTTTKDAPGGRTDGSVAGPDLLRELLAADPPMPPMLAIGGLDAERAGLLAGMGCPGVAVCAAVCGSPDPEAAARAIRNAMP